MLSRDEEQFLNSPSTFERKYRNTLRFRIRKKFKKTTKILVSCIKSGNKEADYKEILGPLVEAYISAYGHPGTQAPPPAGEAASAGAQKGMPEQPPSDPEMADDGEPKWG